MPDGVVLVDVGGGLGSTSMAIAKKYPSFRIVNQDLAPTIEDAKPVKPAINASSRKADTII